MFELDEEDNSVVEVLSNERDKHRYAPTQNNNTNQGVEQIKYMHHSVERVLCDKCGSPANMTNVSMNYLQAPSDRL